MKHSTDKERDQILIDRAVLGDRKAFELLVRQYQGRVAAVIARMVPDPDKVRDLTQETFIKAYRALPTFRGDSAFFTWLFRIASNTAKSYFLAKGREVPLSDVALEDTDSQVQDHETPERQVLRKEMLANLQSAIDTLVPDVKQAVLLRDVQEHSYEEIAKIQDCPIGTVRSRIFRGRQGIIQQMRPYLDRQGTA